MAIEGDLSFYRGEDIVVTDTIYQADEVTIQDISGWSLQFTVRRAFRDADPPILVKTTGGGGITIPVGTDGKLRIALASADTSALDTYPDQQYVFDVSRIDSGQVAELTVGVLVLNDVVRIS